jgi:hypothetical protein
MYHNKFLKQKTDKNWETYRKQRNLLTKLKKTSIKAYFFVKDVSNFEYALFTSSSAICTTSLYVHLNNENLEHNEHSFVFLR